MHTFSLLVWQQCLWSALITTITSSSNTHSWSSCWSVSKTHFTMTQFCKLRSQSLELCCFEVQMRLMGNNWKSDQRLCFGSETPITCDDFQADSGNWQAIHLMKLGEEDHADGDYSRSSVFRDLNQKWVGPSLFFSEEHSVGRMKFETLPFREQYDLLRERSVDNEFKLDACLSREKKATVGKFHVLCDVTKPCKTSN